jgi:hypothetical protein
MNNQENIQPNFYAIIPAHIRYDKDLEPNAKLLYGEITALASQYGYCWASNEYFEKLYDVDERTIRRWISSLSKKKYIHVELIVNGFQRQRKIWISEEIQKIFTSGQKCPDVGTKMSGRGDKNVRSKSNTSSNTSNNPPLQSSKKIEKPEIPKREEEDFLNLVSFLNFSESQLDKLRKYSLDKLRDALEIFNTQKVKKSKIGLLLDILDNPQRWEIPLEEQYTHNQLLALRHNEFLKKYFTKEKYEKNIETIKNQFFMIVFDKFARETTISCSEKKLEKDLIADLKESELGALLISEDKMK